MKPEQERLMAVLKDTVSLLCKNSLTFEEQVVVQGLICITVDKQDVLVVPVHESIGVPDHDPCVACGHVKNPPLPPGDAHSPHKRKRRRRPSNQQSPHQDDSSEEDETSEPDRLRVKKEEDSGEDSDLVMIDADIKGEVHNDSSFITGYMDNTQLSGITATAPPLLHEQQQALLATQHSNPWPPSNPQSMQSSQIAPSAPSDRPELDNMLTPDGKFPCPIPGCSVSIGNKHNLRRHILNRHQQHRPHKCPLCPYSASQKSNVARHLRKVHKLMEAINPEDNLTQPAEVGEEVTDRLPDGGVRLDAGGHRDAVSLAAAFPQGMTI